MHLRNIIALLMVLAAPLAGAKVSEEEAARLGQDLTPGGAEKAANGDGSIPAWGGTIRGLPPGLDWGGPGTVYPDPYAGEKPLFSITADKMAEYAQRLKAIESDLAERSAAHKQGEKLRGRFLEVFASEEELLQTGFDIQVPPTGPSSTQEMPMAMDPVDSAPPAQPARDLREIPAAQTQILQWD